MKSMPKFARRALAVVPAVLALMLVAAPAQASRVSQSSDSLEFDADGGEVNRVAVTFAVSGGQLTTTISDTQAISISGSCSYPDGGNRQVVTCTTSHKDSVRADLDLGNQDDSIRVNQTDPSRGPAVRIQDGSGDDVITVNQGTTTWVNGAGADIYRGGSGRDVALAGDGDDLVTGGYGNDSIDGGNGNDQVSGGVGDDTVDGGAGFDIVEGNSQNDVVRGGPDGDFVFGGGGNDRLEGNSGYDRLFGGPGADTLDGSRTEDVKFG